MISICIGMIQKPRHPFASPEALSALKKYDSNANGFDITDSSAALVRKRFPQ
jgi:hypothetical protein